MRFGVVGIDGESLFVLLDCLRDFSLLGKYVAQVAVRLRIVRLQLDRPPIRVDGRVQVAALLERVAQVVVRLRVVRVEFDCPPILRHRFVEPSQPGQCGAEIDEDLHATGAELDHPAIHGDRLVEPNQKRQGSAQTEADLGKVGFNFQRPAIRGNGVIELIELARADDRCGDHGLRQHPRQCYLRGLGVARLGDLKDAVHDGEVRVAIVEVVRIVVGAGARGLGLARGQLAALTASGKESARQRRPRNTADLLVEAQRNHLALFFAIDQVVVVLHGDEAREPVRRLKLQHLLKLPSVHARSTEVERLAGLHHIVQRLAGLFDGRVLVEAVNLIEVNIIHAEALQAGVNRGQDVLAREAAVVGRVGHRIEDLGGDDQLFAARLELTQQFAGQALALAQRVHVSGIEEVDARLDRALHDGPRLVLFEDPLAPLLRAVGHHAQAQGRDAGARRSQRNGW